MSSAIHWHTLSKEKALERTLSQPQGLSSDEAQKRLDQYGPNQLKEKAKKSAFAMFLDQFKDFMIIVLLIAAVIAGIVGEVTDTIAIIVIVILNALIGFFQEYRAEKAMEALKKMSAPSSTTLRDGRKISIDAKTLVQGDVVLLEAGDIVPADLRLIESHNFQVEEAALTGESLAVEKTDEPLDDESLAIADRKNMAYKQTIVTYGRAAGLVVETGMNTEIGNIASMLQSEQKVKTPLQKRLTQFSKKLAVGVLILCLIFFVAGVLRGEAILLMLLTAISLAVAAIPEALPAVVTITLALGSKKLVKKFCLMRKLPAVETLGSVTYICSDKTGTLTVNKMSVEDVYCPDPAVKENLLTAMAISNDADHGKNEQIIGDPTEAALLAYGNKHGYRKSELNSNFHRIKELPFDSDRKKMTTIHNHPDGGFISFTKGATEVLSKDPLIQQKAEEMAKQGLRTLAFGQKRWQSLPQTIDQDTIECDVDFIGLVGMMDPPRPEAAAAVGLCKTAGIVPVMITGDHKVTAQAIAKRVGILDDANDDQLVLNADELAKLSEEEFKKKVLDVRVYSRATPEQKLRIIEALQKNDQFVAMTGDGVNDAPALKKAEIGVAMGITGTEVSKEASDMILLDDNFATIVGAVKEGRRIFDNIRKFIKYTMTSNSGELWTLFLAPLVGLPIPLLPIHILWINIVTDGLPGLALAVEKAEPNIMNKPPRHPHESIFANGLGYHIIWVGLLMGLVALGTQYFGIAAFPEKWQTMVFTVLCLSQIGHVLSIRSESLSFFSGKRLFTNRSLWGAVLLTLALQLATIYVPAFNKIFHTVPLSLNELLLTLGLSTVVFFAVEVEKIFKRLNGKSSSEQNV